MEKSGAVLFTVLAVAAMLLTLGCVTTMNPQDLARPAQPGNGAGLEGGNSTPVQTALTMADVARHNSSSDCWMAINSKILDLSSFTNHAGGEFYVPYCGKDGTAAYNAVWHSAYADSLMGQYVVGVLGQLIGTPTPSESGGPPPGQGTGNSTGNAGNQTEGNIAPPGANASSAQPQVLSVLEVAKHNASADCWMIINNNVLNLTDLVSHPGGSAYAPYCGKDGTAAYNAVGHSAYADSMLNAYLVGVLGQAIVVSKNDTNSTIPPVPPPNITNNITANITNNTLPDNILTKAVVAQHNAASDCWMIIGGNVYDLSPLTGHPGGSAYIPYCGKDGTAAYNAVGHSAYADSMMADYLVGILGQPVDGPPATTPPPAGNGSSITLSRTEVAAHNMAADCWMIIGNYAYDLNLFSGTPVGSTYSQYCGKDGSIAFSAATSSQNQGSLVRAYRLGAIGQQIALPSTSTTTRLIVPRNIYEDDD